MDTWDNIGYSAVRIYCLLESTDTKNQLEEPYYDIQG